MKRALITGVTGQDGSYLAEFLANKGYEVYGLMRRSSTDPLIRIQHLVTDKKIKLLYGNLRDLDSLKRALEISRPDEIYNLAALSDVGISFLCPDETWEIDYYGVGKLVNEAVKQNPQVRIYQASTSEMYGNAPAPQSEQTPFLPVSPYAEAKLKAHEDYIKAYRDRYGYFLCSGILFNHESPRRGKHFVTRKITNSFAKIKLGLQESVTLGNLEAKRDWGYAKDYVEAMWLMLQQTKPDDYVIATGETRSVREFVEAAADAFGMKLFWEGSGLSEVAKDEHGIVRVKIGADYFRPNEVNYLLGDSSKAQKQLGWNPRKTSFHEMVKLMVESDLAEVEALNAVNVLAKQSVQTTKKRESVYIEIPKTERVEKLTINANAEELLRIKFE